jgi:hypothetical protein
MVNIVGSEIGCRDSFITLSFSTKYFQQQMKCMSARPAVDKPVLPVVLPAKAGEPFSVRDAVNVY